jgi:hypothetical protein
MPCTNRAVSSTAAADSQPNASVDRLIRPRPTSATERSPNLATSAPLGSDPISVPAG